MKRFTVSLVDSGTASPDLRREVIQVFESGFLVGDTAESTIARYFSDVKGLLLARQGDKLVGFQFYQEKPIGGTSVRHFSLAARLPGEAYRGVQAEFAQHLLRRAILRTVPWKPTYIAGVTNSPKSYGNMHAIGGKCFPDILRPAAANPFGDWYRQVAEQLGMAQVDARGLLRHRMRNLNFSLRSEKATTHPIGMAYERYVENDLGHGLFTLIEIIPMRDVPPYVIRKAMRRGQLRQALDANVV